MERIGLYEYLGRPVPLVTAEGTAMSHSENETYDDDDGLESLAGPQGAMTIVTKQDYETYDDDAALTSLDAPYVDGTSATFVDDETYDDDPGLQSLRFPGSAASAPELCVVQTSGDSGPFGVSFPIAMTSTEATRIDNETYDDNPSIDPHGVW